jgi:hypothetical protein
MMLRRVATFDHDHEEFQAATEDQSLAYLPNRDLQTFASFSNGTAAEGS